MHDLYVSDLTGEVLQLCPVFIPSEVVFGFHPPQVLD